MSYSHLKNTMRFCLLIFSPEPVLGEISSEYKCGIKEERELRFVFLHGLICQGLREFVCVGPQSSSGGPGK